MVARGRPLEMAFSIVDAHPTLTSSTICDKYGNKNQYGLLLAELGFRDDQIRKMSVHDTILNITQGYRGLTFPHAALIRYINDHFSTQAMIDHSKSPIIENDKAIKLALRDPALFLGDNSSLVLKFAELLMSYSHQEIISVAELARGAERHQLNNFHKALEEGLEETYGSKALGQQFARSADGLIELSLDTNFFRENQVEGNLSRDFVLLTKIASHEIQIAAMVDINRTVLPLFTFPGQQNRMDIESLGNIS